MYLNDLPDGALVRITIYADDTSAYSSIKTSDFFDWLDMTVELEEELRCIVDRVVSFNATRDTLPLRPFCTYIKPPSAHVWRTAPIFGVVLHNRVALICLIGPEDTGQFNWPCIVINSADSISQKSCSKPQLVLQVLRRCSQ